MAVYAVRKRDGRWAIYCAQTVSLSFESYEEALEIARTAAAVIVPRAREVGRTRDTACIAFSGIERSRPDRAARN